MIKQKSFTEFRELTVPHEALGRAYCRLAGINPYAESDRPNSAYEYGWHLPNMCNWRIYVWNNIVYPELQRNDR